MCLKRMLFSCKLYQDVHLLIIDKNLDTYSFWDDDEPSGGHDDCVEVHNLLSF